MPYPRPKPPAGGIKSTFPGFIAPALATSIGKVPNGERWVHEIKFDGYRVQVHLRDAAVKVFTRPKGRSRRVAHQCRVGDHRWRGGGPGRGRHHGLLGVTERTQGSIQKDRDGRLRLALPQRLRPAESAAIRA